MKYPFMDADAPPLDIARVSDIIMHQFSAFARELQVDERGETVAPLKTQFDVRQAVIQTLIAYDAFRTEQLRVLRQQLADMKLMHPQPLIFSRNTEQPK